MQTVPTPVNFEKARATAWICADLCWKRQFCTGLGKIREGWEGRLFLLWCRRLQWWAVPQNGEGILKIIQWCCGVRDLWINFQKSSSDSAYSCEFPESQDDSLNWWYRLGRQSAYLQYFFQYPSMARGQAINRPIELFNFVYVCRNLHLPWIYSTGLSFSLFQNSKLHYGWVIFGSSPYSTFHTFILGIPMSTSKRTL